MLLNASKFIDLAVNTGKTKYMEIGRHRENERGKLGRNTRKQEVEEQRWLKVSL